MVVIIKNMHNIDVKFLLALIKIQESVNKTFNII